jgi:hypothetical protein
VAEAQRYSVRRPQIAYQTRYRYFMFVLYYAALLSYTVSPSHRRNLANNIRVKNQPLVVGTLIYEGVELEREARVV